MATHYNNRVAAVFVAAELLIPVFTVYPSPVDNGDFFGYTSGSSAQSRIIHN
jgi:hypothetical protein